MATQAESVAALNHQVVANAFVEQYYTKLAHCSEEVHKFYDASSVISRENSDGSMFSVSTIEEMEKVFLDFKRCTVQILTVDAQNSLSDGVIVLVTGFMIGKDNIGRKFSQLFFLARKEASYDVLNDIFRYVDEGEVASLETNDSAPSTSVAPESEPPLASSYSEEPDHVATPSEDDNQVTESTLPLENWNIPSAEDEFVADSVAANNETHSVSVSTSENDVQVVTDATVSTIQENAQKPTFAALANALNSISEPFRRRVMPAKATEWRVAPAASAPVTRVASQPITNNGVEKKANNTVKGYSIFVANLPMDATVEQLKQVFEKYGPIKPNGIQVRSYKQEKNCFGFVEFESADSMKRALEDSSIFIGNRQAHIEEKKATSDGGKFRKGGYRSESLKNRGSRGYGRTESEDQTGFSGHARGGRGRNAESNPREWKGEPVVIN